MAFVLCALVLGSAGKLRLDGLFACPSAYAGDDYLAYCQAAAYGDYDHGGVWFGLEPALASAVANAQVLFLGSSRMQFGLSSVATESWFRSAGLTYFLLGFSHTENVAFVEPLLDRLRPRAQVYVLNVDRFFVAAPTAPAQEIMSNPAAARDAYLAKRRWQPLHRFVCSSVNFLCGDHVAFFRNRATGVWHLDGNEAFVVAPVSEGQPDGQAEWPMFQQRAEAFVAALPVPRDCVILTLVPYHGTRRAEAEAIASQLGLDLISPRLEGLTTFDESHLDASSAEKWSAAFLEAAGDRIERCLNATR